MTEITIRDATPQDVDAIRRIAELGWNETYGDFLSQESIERAMEEWYDATKTREFIERDEIAYFVAEHNGAVIGYISGGPSDEEDIASLGAVYVDPAYWGEGVGTVLIDEFESYCCQQGYGGIRVTVLSDNEIGISFYQKHGYDLVDERDTELFEESVRERIYSRSLNVNIEY